MKHQLTYLAALGLAAAMGSCHNDFELPPMIVPEATIQANTSILDLKERYWQSDRNYCSEIGTTLDGSGDLIIGGRIVSSDSTGNIFKNIVVYDGTAALTIAINAYDLYQSYQYGQEIVIDCTGLQIGGYNGLMQMGSESTYNGSPSMTFMDKTLFDTHAQINGLSQPSKVVPEVRTIPEILAYAKDQKSLMAYQSMLVKIENVSFVDAGQKFAPTATTDRYITDAEGNRLNVRCSSYSTFKNEIIPGGSGSVTAILSYYGTAWQLMLNGLNGLEGFTPIEIDPNAPGNEPQGTGTKDDPYNVVKALEVAEANGENSDKDVYTMGYVISGSIDVNYGNGTWVIADDPNAAAGAKTITVYRAKDFNNEKFTDANKVKVGDKIVVCAPLINFKGNTPETSYGYLYSINGATK